MAEKNSDVAAMGLGGDDRPSRRFHGRGGFDNDAVIGLIKFWTVVNLYRGFSVKTLMRNRNAPEDP